MMNIEICQCDYQSFKREFKQGICFADSERCGYNFFCNTCYQPKHKEHLAECQSIQKMEYQLQIISAHLKSDLEAYQSFISKLRKRKVLNAQWIQQIKKAKKILDDEYREASGNYGLLQKYQDPAQRQEIFRIFEDEINSTKDLLKEKEKQVERLLGYLENQQYDRFFNSTPFIKKLFRIFEEYRQFNLKEKLEQEIVNSEQTEIQYYKEKLEQINTLNELGHFNIALNTLKELRKSFKNEQLDKLYGQQLIKSRKYDEAEQYYQDQSVKRPKLFWPAEGRIDCLMEMGQSTEAQSYIDLLVKNRKHKIKLHKKKQLIQQQQYMNTGNREQKI